MSTSNAGPFATATVPRATRPPQFLPAGMAAAPRERLPVARRGWRQALWQFAFRTGPALALVAAASCTRPQDPASERMRRLRHGTDPLVIAAPWPWSAMPGVRYGDGMELAIEEVNAGGGVRGRKLRVLRVDDQQSVDHGRVVAQQIVRDPSVVAVIGHLQSYVTMPAAAIYDMAGLVHLAPTASDPQLTMLGYKRVFRCTFTHRDVGRTMANEARARNASRLAIYYMRDGYGRGVANAFEERASELGMSIVARQSFDANQPPDAETVERLVRKWKEIDVGGVFIAGESAEAAQLLQTMHQVGMKASVFGSDAVGTPDLPSKAGVAVEGLVLAATFSPDDPRREVRHFVEAFRRRYGVIPDAGAAFGYNAVSILAAAMQQAPTSDPDAITASLRRLHAWPSLLGPVTFDASGELAAPRVVTLVVRNGHYVLPTTGVSPAPGTPALASVR